MNTILILHGWGASSKSWTRVKELLGNQGYKVYVPDLPGFGSNPAPPRAWSVDNYVGWVRDFCEKQGLSRFFLLGHSFGGRLAIKFAVKYPEKLKGLILVATAGVTKRKSLRNFLFLFLTKIGTGPFSLSILNQFKPLAQKVIYKLAGSRDYLFAQGLMKETMKRVIAEDLKPYLSKITITTLIIWGEKDKITPLADAYLIKKEIPNSTLEIIPQIGHRLNFDAPEILTGKILNFIKQWN